MWRKQPKVLRQLNDPKVTLIRAHLVLLGAGCMVVAISYLPLATANAVFYAAPLLMLPLSILFLKERPSRGKVIATVTGFLGVLIVLRPSQFHWAACLPWVRHVRWHSLTYSLAPSLSANLS